MIDEEDYCQYTRSKTLTYHTTIHQPEVTFKCQIGVFEDYVTISVNEDFNEERKYLNIIFNHSLYFYFLNHNSFLTQTKTK